ncbi:MAG: DUF1836 domain-containing protein [Oscillospiraceae bacterium]|nr:DUF1836 domain-containing protein [Oscillospiraceae bacterium]
MSMDTPPKIDLHSLKPAFEATGGMMLNQICEITGVEAHTVQNWIKRGWVASPAEKKYSERHAARVLIFDMLKGALQLEKIAQLMAFINGDANDRSDDIIDDSELYMMIRKGAMEIDEKIFEQPLDIRRIASDCMEAYSNMPNEAGSKLFSALCIMLTAYLASAMKAKAESDMEKLFE